MGQIQALHVVLNRAPDEGVSKGREGRASIRIKAPGRSQQAHQTLLNQIIQVDLQTKVLHRGMALAGQVYDQAVMGEGVHGIFLVGRGKIRLSAVIIIV